MSNSLMACGVRRWGSRMKSCGLRVLSTGYKPCTGQRGARILRTVGAARHRPHCTAWALAGGSPAGTSGGASGRRSSSAERSAGTGSSRSGGRGGSGGRSGGTGGRSGSAGGSRTRLISRGEQQRTADLQQAARTATRLVERVAKNRFAAAAERLPQRLEGLVPFVDLVAPPQDAGEEADDEAGGSQRKATRSRGAKRSAAIELLASYRSSFQAALDLELQEEWGASEERLRSWTRARLEEEGMALFGLEASQAGSLFQDALLRFAVRGRDSLLPFHNFSQGDVVLISKGRPLDDESVEGVVLDYSTRWLRVAVPMLQAANLQGGGWRLDLYANTAAYERATAAVKEFTRPDGATAAATATGAAETQHLMRILAGNVPSGTTAEAMAQQAPSWLRGKEGRERMTAARRSLLEAAKQLNSSQKAAIEAALGRTLTLWQGPPGTGKTTTLLRYVTCLLASLPRRSQVLATAASNVAVDNLAAGLQQLGVAVVRVGQPAKVSPALWGMTLAARVDAHPKGRKAALLREKLAGMDAKAVSAVLQEALQLENEAAAEILDGAQVIAATCIGAGDVRLAERAFRACVVDEATQATEPHNLVPLLKQVESLLLVGDPQQLPPTVLSATASGLGLDVSLFVRLNRMKLTPLLLAVQYRMHPAIAAFPSHQFYGGRLISHPRPEDRPAPRGLRWPNPQVPVVFVQCDAPDALSSLSSEATGTSYCNKGQAELMLAALQRLLQGGDLAGPPAIGIITPYSGQVRLLRDMCQAEQLLGEQADGGADALEIKSVDGFQGREKEVILFSTVRSNPQRNVGFLDDQRRLNVAITRAKRGLVVVGDQRTLSSDPCWSAWLRWADRQGVVVDAAQLLTGRGMLNAP